MMKEASIYQPPFISNRTFPVHTPYITLTSSHRHLQGQQSCHEKHQGAHSDSKAGRSTFELRWCIGRIRTIPSAARSSSRGIHYCAIGWRIWCRGVGNRDLCESNDLNNGACSMFSLLPFWLLWSSCFLVGHSWDVSLSFRVCRHISLASSLGSGIQLRLVVKGLSQSDCRESGTAVIAHGDSGVPSFRDATRGWRCFTRRTSCRRDGGNDGGEASGADIDISGYRLVSLHFI
jgi:hypothetical protein